jgi:hypothetical protein
MAFAHPSRRRFASPTEAQKQNRLAMAQFAEVSGVGDKEDVQEALKRGAETAQTLG